MFKNLLSKTSTHLKYFLWDDKESRKVSRLADQKIKHFLGFDCSTTFNIQLSDIIDMPTENL